MSGTKKQMSSLFVSAAGEWTGQISEVNSRHQRGVTTIGIPRYAPKPSTQGTQISSPRSPSTAHNRVELPVPAPYQITPPQVLVDRLAQKDREENAAKYKHPSITIEDMVRNYKQQQHNLTDDKLVEEVVANPPLRRPTHSARWGDPHNAITKASIPAVHTDVKEDLLDFGAADQGVRSVGRRPWSGRVCMGQRRQSAPDLAAANYLINSSSFVMHKNGRPVGNTLNISRSQSANSTSGSIIPRIKSDTLPLLPQAADSSDEYRLVVSACSNAEAGTYRLPWFRVHKPTPTGHICKITTPLVTWYCPRGTSWSHVAQFGH